MNKNQEIQLEYGEQALQVARSLNMLDASLDGSGMAINVGWTGSDADWDTGAWRLKSEWAIYVTGYIEGHFCRLRVYFGPDSAAPGRFVKKEWHLDGGPPRRMGYLGGEFPN